MQYLGIPYSMKHTPALDPGFIPLGIWMESYQKGAQKPVAVAVERNNGYISVFHTHIHGSPEMADADYRYLERYVKFLLWSIGGFRIYVCGCSELAQRLQKAYNPQGERWFDCDFFFKLYERELEVIDLPLENCRQPAGTTEVISLPCVRGGGTRSVTEGLPQAIPQSLFPFW